MNTNRNLRLAEFPMLLEQDRLAMRNKLILGPLAVALLLIAARAEVQNVVTAWNTIASATTVAKRQKTRRRLRGLVRVHQHRRLPSVPALLLQG